MPAEVVRAEIAEQPAALAALTARWDDLVAAVARVLPRPLRGVALVARGSSDFAAVHARYLIELATGVPVMMVAPSLWTRYEVARDLGGWGVVALSQSGRTPEVVTVAERTRAAGARVVAITNDDGSDLASIADAHLLLGTTPERAVPATKTVTTELLAVAAVATACAGDDAPPWLGGRAERAVLSEQIAGLVADRTPVSAALALLAGAPNIVQVGRTLTYVAALEGALKMKETCGRPVEGFSSADFLHGPAAVAGPRTTVVAYNWPGPTSGDVLGAVRAAAALGSSTIAVGPAAAWRDAPPNLDVPVAQATPAGLAVIPLVVRGQQLAIELAVHLGFDPDAPAGLSKVTETT
jgi:glucosamine--fructose-6-phosphate aminotransferase (isomerizing)